jgi:3-deoxy-D-manno-octulosonate 8-phosphate phosphatase (KDO 8-P phosphatase)
VVIIDMSLTSQVSDKLGQIKLIVSDFDGVLSQGGLYLGENGEEVFSKFNIYDGFAVVMAHECGLKVAIISGRKSLCTESRCRNLGIDEVHTGILDKAKTLQEIMLRYGYARHEVAFIGDDLIDLPAMKLVGLTICPQNGVYDVKQRVDYITKTDGGNGVLREVVDLILKHQNKYQDYLQRYL